MGTVFFKREPREDRDLDLMLERPIFTTWTQWWYLWRSRTSPYWLNFLLHLLQFKCGFYLADDQLSVRPVSPPQGQQLLPGQVSFTFSLRGQGRAFLNSRKLSTYSFFPWGQHGATPWLQPPAKCLDLLISWSLDSQGTRQACSGHQTSGKRSCECFTGVIC